MRENAGGKGWGPGCTPSFEKVVNMKKIRPQGPEWERRWNLGTKGKVVKTKGGVKTRLTDVTVKDIHGAR